jgi:hypothetical protein
VLTYSLLQGIKLDWQKVLRRDPQSDLPEYLDVSMLFNYAADEVPKLAEGIGGIQRPLIAARGDARSFDIGRITSEDRAAIPLPSKKAVFLRSSFQLEGRPRDPLELTKRLDARLLEASTQRLDSSLVFWDVPSYAGAYRLAGLYEESGSNVTAKVFLSRFVQEGDETVERDLGDPFTVQGEDPAGNLLLNFTRVNLIYDGSSLLGEAVAPYETVTVAHLTRFPVDTDGSGSYRALLSPLL